MILSNSQIKSIDTIPLVNLEYLNAECTAITELSTVSLGKIHLLWLTDVKIKTLEPQNMQLIEVFCVADTDLTVLEVSGCTRLRDLRCDGTNISQL